MQWLALALLQQCVLLVAPLVLPPGGVHSAPGPLRVLRLFAKARRPATPPGDAVSQDLSDEAVVAAYKEALGATLPETCDDGW